MDLKKAVEEYKRLVIEYDDEYDEESKEFAPLTQLVPATKESAIAEYKKKVYFHYTSFGYPAYWHSERDIGFKVIEK